MASAGSAAARSSRMPSSSSSEAARSRPSEPASAATSSSPSRSTNSRSTAATSAPPVSRRPVPPQQPQRLADLAPVEEPLAANGEPDAGARQRILDGRQLGVDADQNRRLRRRDFSRADGATPGDDLAQLGLGIRETMNGGPRSLRPGRPQRAAWPAGHEPVGELQDLRAGAVVLGQRDGARAGMAVGEAQQELRRGAGEGVDRLVRVADHRQIARLAEPQLEEPFGQRVRVLVFVDAEPALARSNQRGRLGVGLEQLDRLRRACPRSRAGRPPPSTARSRGRRGRTGRPGSALDRRLRGPTARAGSGAPSPIRSCRPCPSPA